MAFTYSLTAVLWAGKRTVSQTTEAGTEKGKKKKEKRENLK